MHDLKNRSWEFDVLVVGARCAGAATAMLLARRGLRVLAIDRARRGTDTLSTHALMRGGVMQLARWGLLDRVVASGTPPVRTTTFHYGAETIAVPIKPKYGVDALYAPRRLVLDDILVHGAEEAGAHVAFGVRLVDLLRTSRGRVSGAVIESGRGQRRVVRASLVIGADGLRSTVARLAGARTERVGASRAAVIYGYWNGLPGDGYHWHWAPGVSAGVIPTNGPRACVFASMPAARFLGDVRFRGDGYREVLAEAAPGLGAALDGATLDGTLRAFAGDPGLIRESHGPGWALVGDAGWFRDPITAHGITDAFRDAESLASAVASGTEAAMRHYAEARHEMAMPLFELSDRIASYEWTLDELQVLHRALSDEMVREAEWIDARHRSAAATPVAAQAAVAAAG